MATTIADKLQIRPGQRLRLLNSSAGPSLPDVATVEADGAPLEASDAALVFVVTRADLDRWVADVLPHAQADRLTWVAYPKGGLLGTDLSRDTLAALLRDRGVRPIRQVALDETWSALRIRPG